MDSFLISKISINAIAFINLIIMALVIFVNARKNSGLVFLGLLFLGPGIYSLTNIMVAAMPESTITNIFAGLAYFLSLQFPVFLGHYVRTVLRKPNKLFGLWNIFLVIGILLATLVSFDLASNDISQTQAVINANQGNYPESQMLTNAYVSFLLLFCLIQSFILIRKRIKFTKTYFAELNALDGAYLQQFILIIFGSNLLSVFAYTIWETSVVEGLVYPIWFILVYGWMLYVTIKRSSMFKPEQMSAIEASLKQIQPISSPAKKQEENKSEYVFAEKLIKLVDEDKIYQKQNLTIEELSKEIGVKSYLVSEYINRQHQVNFFEFINQKRVVASAELIKEGALEKITIEALGEQVGFSSRTTFYRAFKKELGVSPSNYN